MEDRPLVNRVHDKLYNVYREPHVHQVLRSYARDDGLLTAEQLGQALDQLKLGLAPGEKQRILARVQPAEHGKVSEHPTHINRKTRACHPSTPSHAFHSALMLLYWMGTGKASCTWATSLMCASRVLAQIHYRDFLRTLEVPAPLGGDPDGPARARCGSLPGPAPPREVDATQPRFWNWQRHNRAVRRARAGSLSRPGALPFLADRTALQAASEAPRACEAWFCPRRCPLRRACRASRTRSRRAHPRRCAARVPPRSSPRSRAHSAATHRMPQGRRTTRARPAAQPRPDPHHPTSEPSSKRATPAGPTTSQAQSDALLTTLLSSKLAQHRDKLRRIFRRMDANRNSTIDRDEFARGIAKLRINVSRAQVSAPPLLRTRGQPAFPHRGLVPGARAAVKVP